MKRKVVEGTFSGRGWTSLIDIPTPNYSHICVEIVTSFKSNFRDHITSHTSSYSVLTSSHPPLHPSLDHQLQTTALLHPLLTKSARVAAVTTNADPRIRPLPCQKAHSPPHIRRRRLRRHNPSQASSRCNHARAMDSVHDGAAATGRIVQML